jgi:predicted NUDIX family NTP pyrophosphohydrolase
MAKQSAGILLYRRRGGTVEVFLVHPGGPFWKKRDEGAWTIPKGAVETDEEPLTAAQREFTEETGFTAAGPFIELGAFKQPGGKTVLAWAAVGEADPAAVKSNLFEMEWPPRSGRRASFPEVDRAAWFAVDEARSKILKGQWPIIEALLQQLSEPIRPQETT